MKTACVAALATLGCASAFVPSVQVASLVKQAPRSKATTTMGALDGYVGTSVETKDKPWDPLGLASLSEVGLGTEGMGISADVKWLREAELKHGRICMLAFVGIVTTHAGIHLPGCGYETSDWTQAAQEFAQKNPFGFAQLLMSIGLAEGQSDTADLWKGEGDREAGDLGWDFLNAKKKAGGITDATRLKELKNGRLAMLAVTAFFCEHYNPGSVPALTGQGW